MNPREEYRAYITESGIADISTALDASFREINMIAIEQLSVQMTDDSAVHSNWQATAQGAVYQNVKQQILTADISVCAVGNTIFGTWLVTIIVWDFDAHRAIELATGCDIDSLINRDAYGNPILNYPIGRVSWGKSQQNLIKIENTLERYLLDLRQI